MRRYSVSSGVIETRIRRPCHFRPNEIRDSDVGSTGANDSPSASQRIPPKPSTTAVQVPAIDAMCMPWSVLPARSCRSTSAASARYWWASSRCPVRAAITDWVHADSDESRTVIAS